MQLNQPIKNIIRIEARGNFTTAILIDGRSIPMNNSINELESTLSKWHFIRIHPLHLINPRYYKQICEVTTPCIEMHDGAKLPVNANLIDIESLQKPIRKSWWQKILFPFK